MQTLCGASAAKYYRFEEKQVRFIVHVGVMINILNDHSSSFFGDNFDGKVATILTGGITVLGGFCAVPLLDYAGRRKVCKCSVGFADLFLVSQFYKMKLNSLSRFDFVIIR